MHLRNLFFHHIAQTSPSPLAFQVEKAEGVWLYGPDGERLLDFISGIAVSNIGHRHPKVLEAISEQAGKYLHTMVYGEMILSPQVLLAERLCHFLPATLDSVYFVNSGSEAVEGALKLAKKVSGRSKIISMHNAYHGSTHGALSVTGNEALKQGYGSMLPEIEFIPFNDKAAFMRIDEQVAAVIVEGIQGEAGVVLPDGDYLQALRKRCTEQGTLLILDEIQTGFGRTGTLFYLEQAGIIPDILTLAKGMGGGLPIGGFIASREHMLCLTHSPVLGHITTFGGHPLSCAAALACLNVITNPGFLESLHDKEQLIIQKCREMPVKEFRGKGMMYTVVLDDFSQVEKVIQSCLRNGLLTDWFLFAPNQIRIAPPLTIDIAELEFGLYVLDQGLRMGV